MMWMVVCCLYLAFFASGVTFNIIPPTFNDLLVVFSSSIGDLLPVYTWRSAGYLIGTIVGGFVLNFLNRHLCLAIALILMAMTVALLPFCGDLQTLLIVAAVNGVTSGSSDVATNVWLLDMFKEKSGPYIQGLYFFFALGSSIVPVLVTPFLKENNFGETKIHSAYVGNGILVLISSIALFALCLMNREAIINTRRESVWFDWKSIKLSNLNLLIIIGLSSFLILIYSGFEICFIQFMPTFVTQSKLVTDTDAAFMDSAMNIAYTCFRGISVMVNIKIESYLLIYFDLISLSVATTLLFMKTSKTILYFVCVFMGIGFSSIYPSIYAFVEKYIDVTNFIASLFAFASGVMAIIYPTLIAGHIKQEPNVVLYLNVVSIMLTTVIFIILHIYVQRRNRSLDPTGPAMN